MYSDINLLVSREIKFFVQFDKKKMSWTLKFSLINMSTLNSNIYTDTSYHHLMMMFHEAWIKWFDSIWSV